MLLDNYPALRQLSAAEKLKLADELTEMAIEAADESVRSELRASLAAYRANPHDVVSWEDIKVGLRQLKRAAVPNG